MVIETEHGKFELIKNYREAFDLTAFNEKYVDVAFDRYQYLVGDIASGLLRIKGFNSDSKSPRGFRAIPDYINESCNYNSAYYILKRYKENNDDKEINVDE
ncbi:YutD-like domain-containing protein [Haploplasma axanthum]|nr:YutD-like domain-containing protein [Haploplasma axanthum]